LYILQVFVRVLHQDTKVSSHILAYVCNRYRVFRTKIIPTYGKHLHDGII